MEPPLEPTNGSRVPVTPGIGRETYRDDSNRSSSTANEYFSRKVGGFEAESSFHLQLPRAPPSGNVISATFTLPQQLQHRKGRKWEIQPQHHTSAHLESLQYLSSSESQYNHVLVGWTGEIASTRLDPSWAVDVDVPAPCPTTKSTTLGIASRASPDTEPHTAKVVHVSRAEMDMLQQQLWDDEMRSVPVWLRGDDEIQDCGIRLQNQSRWRSYAEHDLFSAFNYKQRSPTNGKVLKARWKDYLRMNTLFADAISAVGKPGDVIMVHDHYLMLLPAMLRDRHPDMHVVFVLESPFPTSEIVRCLTERQLLLEGVLGANLVCFQAYHYAQHFMSSCARLTGRSIGPMWVEGPRHRTHVAVHPSGINISKVEKMAFSASVDRKCAELAEAFQNRAIIIGHDPMDRLGGIDKKLAAFELFLNQREEWVDKVVLLQFTGKAVSKIDDIEENNAYANKIYAQVSTINSTYGSLDLTPVHLFTHSLSQDDYFAVLRMGNVAANTCVREGLSVTSLEYLVCQKKTKGTLILSEFSGTAEHLREALLVNPWDTRKLADSIYEALTSGRKVREARYDSLIRWVEGNNVERQVGAILKQLEQSIQIE